MAVNPHRDSLQGLTAVMVLAQGVHYGVYRIVVVEGLTRRRVQIQAVDLSAARLAVGLVKERDAQFASCGGKGHCADDPGEALYGHKIPLATGPAGETVREILMLAGFLNYYYSAPI